jgi:hypothetical protein
VEGKTEEVVHGFAAAETSRPDALRVGLLGLTFLDSRWLMIGAGGQGFGVDTLFLVQVPDVGGQSTSIDSAVRIGPLAAEGKSAAVGEFAQLMSTSTVVFVSGIDAARQSWLIAAPIRETNEPASVPEFGRLTRLVPVSQAAAAPPAIAISPRGELLVGEPGNIGETPDSRLRFYRQGDGKLLLDLATGLYDIAAIAYGAPQSPTNKRQLYALDMALSSPEAAGLYRLESQLQGGTLSVRPVQILQLDRPTAMALAPDGSLYITLAGTTAPSENGRPGKLLRFPTGL